jgi:hypothetical protein
LRVSGSSFCRILWFRRRDMRTKRRCIHNMYFIYNTYK